MRRRLPTQEPPPGAFKKGLKRQDQIGTLLFQDRLDHVARARPVAADFASVALEAGAAAENEILAAHQALASEKARTRTAERAGIGAGVAGLVGVVVGLFAVLRSSGTKTSK